MGRLPRDIAAQKIHTDIVNQLESPAASHGMAGSHYDQYNPLGQYNKSKMANSKKRSRTSAPGVGPRVLNASKRKKTNPHFMTKSSGNLSGIGSLQGFGTLSPPQEGHATGHTIHNFHTMANPLRYSHSMQGISNPYASPVMPSRGPNPYPVPYSVDLNQSMPPVYSQHSTSYVEQFKSIPHNHPQARFYEQRFSMINHNYSSL